jgi:hypothetical protein
MTPITIQALRAAMSARGDDDEARELVEGVWDMAPSKTCEGMLSISFGYDAEALGLLVELFSQIVPLKSCTSAPPVVTLNDWPIMFVPGDLHLTGNLPLENTMVLILGDLNVEGVIGSYRDFEPTVLIVKGSIKAHGIEGEKQIVAGASIEADIIWLDGEDSMMKAQHIHTRILYDASGDSVIATATDAEFRYSAARPVDVEAMQRVLAPEAFTPEPGYVFEGFKEYGCINRALRLMQRGLPGFITH